MQRAILPSLLLVSVALFCPSKAPPQGLVFAHTWDCLPPEVLGETHLEETDVFVEEGKTGLLGAEDSKTTDLPDPKDWEISF